MSKRETSDLKEFDFVSFEQEAIKQLKSGKPLSGKEGVITPLIKRILEAALEGELDNHLSDERESGGRNRKNG
ncbi:MAG: IS256 family transposase, partial [Nitrospirae bacterium]|nr:IS256 family transposase [Nitrospirota bacterium]